MTMRSKHTYAALAALAVIVLVLVAACGGGAENGDEPASGGTEPAMTTSDADTTEPADERPYGP
jgi:hypothetical protein